MKSKAVRWVLTLAVLAAVLVFVFMMLGCHHPSRAVIERTEGDLPRITAEGAPSVTLYQTDAGSMITPAGTPIVHGVIDAEGGDLVSASQPIAQIVVRQPDGSVQFIQTPSDIRGSDWEFDGETIRLGEIDISKSDPIEAQAALIAALAPVLDAAIRESQETMRANMREVARMVESGIDLGEAIAKVFAPTVTVDVVGDDAPIPDTGDEP